MNKVTLTFNVEITCQPKQFHSLRMGVVVHEVEVEYDNKDDLEHKFLEMHELYQDILVKAKELALQKGVYSGDIRVNYNSDGPSVTVNVDDNGSYDSVIDDIFGEDDDSSIIDGDNITDDDEYDNDHESAEDDEGDNGDGDNLLDDLENLLL